MKTLSQDTRLLVSLILANICLFITFTNTNQFWLLYTSSCLLLIGFALLNEKMENNLALLPSLGFGIISGLLLYGLFWIGHALIIWTKMPFSDSIASLYTTLSPSVLWQYIALCLLVVPGEELFWRGFVQKRFSNKGKPYVAILASTILYTIPMLYSGNIMLVVSGIFGGACWGFLFYWKRSILLVIFSHLVFDLMLLVILPFR